MKPSPDAFYSQFAERFAQWAADIEDIRAAFVIGSQAREDHPADACSDLDILLFTSRPSFYLEQAAWLDALGKILFSFSTHTAGGDPERITLFDGGYQVDFVVADASALDRLVAAKQVHGNFYRGVKVLVDKDAVSHHIMPDTYRMPAEPITEGAFSHVCHLFWFATLYIAKQILRGDLWVAKARDPELKALVLQMIQWHEKCLHGEAYDTWHAGRFMREWVEPDIWDTLHQSFGHFDAADSWRALLETTRLFSRLSHGVASQMDYPFPETESFVGAWLDAHKDDIPMS